MLGEGFITPDNVQKENYFQSKLPSLDSVDQPLTLEKLEAGNLVRSIRDREGNVTYQEIHGIQGGPKNKLCKFGLRRSIYSDRARQR